jgi:hypothetical protein
MASSSSETDYTNWFLKLPATWWGEDWAKSKYGSDYDKKFDLVRLTTYIPGTQKTEPAYKFDLGKTKNNVTGITDLRRFNDLGYLSGHNVHF